LPGWSRDYDDIYDIPLRSEGEGLIQAIEEVIDVGNRSHLRLDNQGRPGFHLLYHLKITG